MNRRICILILILNFSFHLTAQQAFFPKKCELEDIIIYGSSNLNKFHFFYSQKKLQSYDAEISCLSDSTLILLKIPIHSFKASNPLMYKDFHELLQSDLHPFIKVYLNKNEIEAIMNKKEIQTIAVYNLAGSSQKYSTYFELLMNNGKLELKGNTTLDLKDYNLAIPNKFFGKLKVNNELIVKFKLYFSI